MTLKEKNSSVLSNLSLLSNGDPITVPALERFSGLHGQRKTTLHAGIRAESVFLLLTQGGTTIAIEETAVSVVALLRRNNYTITANGRTAREGSAANQGDNSIGFAFSGDLGALRASANARTNRGRDRGRVTARVLARESLATIDLALIDRDTAFESGITNQSTEGGSWELGTIGSFYVSRSTAVAGASASSNLGSSSGGGISANNELEGVGTTTIFFALVDVCAKFAFGRASVTLLDSTSGRTTVIALSVSVIASLGTTLVTIAADSLARAGRSSASETLLGLANVRTTIARDLVPVVASFLSSDNAIATSSITNGSIGRARVTGFDNAFSRATIAADSVTIIASFLSDLALISTNLKSELLLIREIISTIVRDGHPKVRKSSSDKSRTLALHGSAGNESGIRDGSRRCSSSADSPAELAFQSTSSAVQEVESSNGNNFSTSRGNDVLIDRFDQRNDNIV